MIFRKYIGVVLINEKKVFVMKNEKNEWILPKVKVDDFSVSKEWIEMKFSEEFNLESDFEKIVDDTQYEFFSLTKKAPMCNTVFWYYAQSNNASFTIEKTSKIEDGGFYNIDIALQKITYSQEKNTVLKVLNTLENKKEEIYELA